MRGETEIEKEMVKNKEREKKREQMKESESHLAESQVCSSHSPHKKEDKHSLGQEIELGVREEGIEILKSNYSALKKRLSTGTVSGTGRLILAWVESCWANNSRSFPNPDLQYQALLRLPTMPLSPNDIPNTLHTHRLPKN